MSAISAELSSLSAQIGDVLRRVTDAATELERDGRGDAAAELYEVERALATAARRLDSTRRSLR